LCPTQPLGASRRRDALEALYNVAACGDLIERMPRRSIWSCRLATSACANGWRSNLGAFRLTPGRRFRGRAAAKLASRRFWSSKAKSNVTKWLQEEIARLEDGGSMIDCPPREQLREFLGRGLARDVEQRLMVHVETCPDCQKALESVHRPRCGRADKEKEKKNRPALAPPARVAAPPSTCPSPRQTDCPRPGYEVLRELARRHAVVYEPHLRLNSRRLEDDARAERNREQTIRFARKAETVARLRTRTLFRFTKPARIQTALLALELMDGVAWTGPEAAVRYARVARSWSKCWLGAWTTLTPGSSTATSNRARLLSGGGLVMSRRRPAGWPAWSDQRFRARQATRPRVRMTQTGAGHGDPSDMGPEQVIGEYQIGL